jgi:NADP-dependent 3-hydroxy acid dehydrogenase YdfG
VTSVYPGGIATELLRKVRGAFGRPFDPATLVSPESLAEAVCAVVDAPLDLDITDISVQPAPR